MNSNAGHLEILSDQTDDIDDGMSDRLFLKTLRVFYVTKPSVKPPPQVSFVTSKLFLPIRTGERSFESMSQTMFRIEAWLKVTGVSKFLPTSCMIFYHELYVTPSPSPHPISQRDSPSKKINILLYLYLNFITCMLLLAKVSRCTMWKR